MVKSINEVAINDINEFNHLLDKAYASVGWNESRIHFNEDFDWNNKMDVFITYKPELRDIKLTFADIKTESNQSRSGKKLFNPKRKSKKSKAKSSKPKKPQSKLRLFTYRFNICGGRMVIVNNQLAAKSLSTWFKKTYGYNMPTLKQFEEFEFDNNPYANIEGKAKPIAYRKSVGTNCGIRGCPLEANRFRGHTIKAWSYDMLCAYGQVFQKERFPDMTKPYRTNDYVHEDEVGFYYKRDINGNIIKDKCYGQFPILVATESKTKRCEFVFKLTDKPLFEGYGKSLRNEVKIYDYFKNQIKELGPEYEDDLNEIQDERKKTKLMINISIGCLQNTNPFYRIFIVSKINEIIEELSDEYTIYTSTDSIFSARPRPDIMNNKFNYEFKLEHDGCPLQFRKGSDNYKWVGEKATINGSQSRQVVIFEEINKREFDMFDDIIPDDIWNYTNYVFNYKTHHLEENINRKKVSNNE